MKAMMMREGAQRKVMMEGVAMEAEGRKQREEAQRKEINNTLTLQRKEMMEAMEMMLSKKEEKAKSCVVM